MTTFLISSGQTLSGVILGSSDGELILPGGTATSTIINGGYQDDAGSATGTIINGGIEYVDGGTATGTTIYSGAQLIEFGGTASNTTIYGGYQVLEARFEAGATASNTTIYAGGQGVVSGTTAISTTIYGGAQDDAGTASNTTIYGGVQRVESGGTATSTTIYGGYQDDFGASINTTISSGGAEIIERGGTAAGTVVNGGIQGVESGGTASNTTIYGGVLHVVSGGTASSTTINGGYQDDFGTAINTTINSGGVEIVERGGSATSAVVNGGVQLVESGGTATSTTINGGVQVVDFGGGTAINTTINGGIEYVSAGSTAISTTINGGVEYVYYGGTADGVIFGGPAGLLQLQQPGSLIGTISGWQVGDVIDFSTSSVTSAAISGSTLQVTFSGQSFSYQLAGKEAGTVVQIDQGTALRLVLKPPPAVTETLADDTGTSSTDKITSDPALTGSGDPNATVSFTIDGTPTAATATANAAGAWNYTPAGLADGSHTIMASETDAAGNTGIASLTFTLDTDADVMPTFAAAGGAPVIGIVNLKAVSFAVGGLEDETGTATFSDGSGSIVVPVSGNGTFTADLSALTLNQITSSLSVRDIAGNNFSTMGNTITIDPGPTAGAASIMVAAGVLTDLTSYLLGLDKPGIAGDSLTLFGDNTAGTKGMVTLANGNLTYAAPATPGSDGFRYTVADQYGDTASASVMISAVTIDNIGSASGTVVLGNNSASVGFGQGTVAVVAGNGNDTIAGGSANDTVTAGNGNDAVTLTQGNNTVILGGGNDSVTVGDGNNTIAIAGSAISTDTIKAGSGNNTLYLGAGHETVSVGGGSNTLILTNGTYDVSAGHGTDLFEFTAPQALLDLSLASNDELVFRATGFDLGIDSGLGTATPQPIAASLFSSHTDGTFATPDNRFAYSSATGTLYYDAQGSTPGSTAVAVADLTNHPHLGAASLFFTS